jgi:segregation and condensation protein A
MSHKLKLDIFEGPLDLLLYLIKKNDLDICDISIAEVTEQYMEYIEMMKMLDLELVGDFLVMAATLMQIKSRTLLPPDPNQEEEPEEDLGDELVRRLQEYKIFKEIAEQLKEKELQKKDLYPRKIDEEKAKELVEDAKEVYFEANLFDLISAFTKALNKVKDEPVYEIVEEEFTVDQKIHDILHVILKRSNVFLTDLFADSRNKMEVIVTFMAILELIRLKEIKVMQKRNFADIEVSRNRDNLVPPEAAA